MSIIDQLLKEGVINKKEILSKRYQLLNINEQQAKLVCKLYESNELNLDEVSIEDISETLNLKPETSQMIIESLITDKYIKVVTTKDGIKFNFNYLITSLLRTYLPPVEESSIAEKINWISNMLEISETDDNEFVNKFIEESNWEKLIFIINKLANSNQSKVNWPFIISSYESVNQFKDNKAMREILNANWLED